MNSTRRTFLTTSALAAVASLAGCPTNDGGGGEPTPTATETPAEFDYDGWFDNVSNFDGATVDARGAGTVEVAVGSQGNGGNFAFDPPAVRVDPGTTLRWAWTGQGGAHNVMAAGGDWRSGDPTASADTTFERQFDDPAIVRYYCDPHRNIGMKGAIVVGDGGDGTPTEEAVEYGWQQATFEAYWYSLYNMSTNIAMSGNGVTFPATEEQRSTFQQRVQAIATAADVDSPPVANPNLNMAPFTTGDPHFIHRPVLKNEAGKPDASTLEWDTSRSSGLVSPASLAYTHLKGVTWAKNFEHHFDVLPQEIAPKFRAQVLTTMAQLGIRFAFGQGNLRANAENMLLVSEFDPVAGEVVDDTPRVGHHAAMLWFLADMVSLADNGWFGYVNPEPLISVDTLQTIADGLGMTTMNAFQPADVAGASTRNAGELLAAMGWYGTHAGDPQPTQAAADYANGLADAVAERTDSNGRVANGTQNQAATQGIVGQGLVWASQIDGVDRTDLASDVLGYLFDQLWDPDAGTFGSGPDAERYTITVRDAGDITGGLNAAEAVLGRSDVRSIFATFFDETFNRGRLQRAQRPPSLDQNRDHEPPLPPEAGGEFGQAAVYNAAVEYDTASESWTVTDAGFRTADALYLANQDIWIGQWAGDFYAGRGVPGQTDEPPA